MPWWERIKSVDWIPDRIQHQNWIPDSIQKGELPSKEELKEWHENLNLIPDEIQKPMEEASIALSNEIKRDVERLKNQNWIPDKEQSLGDWFEKFNFVPDEVQRPVEDASSNLYSAVTGKWISPEAKEKWKNGEYLEAIKETGDDAFKGVYRNVLHVVKGTYRDEQHVGENVVRQPLPGEEPVYILINPPGDEFANNSGRTGHVGLVYKGKLISYSSHGYNGSIENFNTDAARAYAIYPSTLNPPMNVENMEKEIDRIISSKEKDKTWFGDKNKDEYNLFTNNCATHVSEALVAGGNYQPFGKDRHRSLTSGVMNEFGNMYGKDSNQTAAPSGIEDYAIRCSSGNIGARKVIEQYRNDLSEREKREATALLANGNESVAHRLIKVDSPDKVPEDRRYSAYKCNAADSRGYYYLRTEEEYAADLQKAYENLKALGREVKNTAENGTESIDKGLSGLARSLRAGSNRLAEMRAKRAAGHKTEEAEVAALRQGRSAESAHNAANDASPAEKICKDRSSNDSLWIKLARYDSHGFNR